VNSWDRIQSLTTLQRTWLLRAAIWLAVVRLALDVASFRRVWSWFGDPVERGCSLTASKRQDALMARWAVLAVARRVPRATCLVRALALRQMLGHLGLPATVQIGVAKPNGSAGLEAHAWVELHGQAWSAGEDLTSFRTFANLAPAISGH
jgi:Transglutaminase-like superfamily